MLVAALAGNAWGRGLFFQNPVIDFEWNGTTFVSSTGLTLTHLEGTTYEFQQDVWWEWYQGANPNNMDNPSNTDPSPHTQDVDLYWSLDMNTSNSSITVPSGYYEKKVDNHYELKQGYGYGSRFRFTLSANNLSGSITVTAYQPDFEYPTGEHNAYTATYTIKINQNIHSHKWDFYSKPLTIINPSDFSATESIGSIYLHAYPQNVTSATSFSTQISATDGLLFTAPSYEVNNNQHYTFGYYDSAPETNSPVDNRYIALHQGATLTIPHSVWSDHNSGIKTRIRIKMGRYGGNRIKLTIGNGKDALENTISGTDTYVIGGSVWWGNKGDYNQHGEYHFVVNDKNEDFTIAVGGTTGDGTWLKLFSIEVYNSDDLITENDVLSNSYQLLNTASTAANGTYYLHYRGKAESTRVQESTIVYSGNITTAKNSFAGTASTSGSSDEHTSPTHTFYSATGNFGTFTMRIECLTHGGTYCTDYASRRQSVGYMASKSYPYTWDFTDIFTYKWAESGQPGRMDAGPGGEGYLQGNNLHLWSATDGTNKFGLRVGLNGGHDVTFCGGSQLWYGQTIIPETAGLAFTPVNYDKTYNNALSLTATGLTFDQTNRDWWGWRVTVPSVPAGGAVYIRAKNAGTDANMRHVKYYIGSGVNNKTNMTEFADASPANKFLVEGKTDEYIYAVYNNTESANDITFLFNEVEVQKIAVSTYKKTFNAKGWTTESRDHDIDPSLTAEMNGRGIKTFLVTDVVYNKEKVTMTDISNAGLMKAATANGEKYACILRNTADNTFEVVNGGFYLFVPDMHDKRGETGTGYQLKDYASSMESSKMEAQLTSGTVPHTNAKDGTYTNFAFTYKYSNTTTGDVQGDLQEGAQSFYRIQNSGASSIGNQGYLPLLKLQIPADVASGSRGFSLMLDEDPESDATAIETVWDSTSKADIYYNMNGQQLNGHPTRRGLYVVNGKKVYVK